MVPGPAMEATAAAVENLLEMQIPRPQPRTTEPGNLGRTSSLYFDEPFRKFWDNAWKTQIQNKKNLGFNQLSTVYLLNDHSVSSLSLTFLICKITQSAKICKHFLAGSVVKNPPANAGAMGVLASSLGGEDLLEEEVATHSRILAGEIPRRGAWRTTVHRVTKSQTRLIDWARTHYLPENALTSTLYILINLTQQATRKVLLSFIPTEHYKARKQNQNLNSGFSNSKILALSLFHKICWPALSPSSLPPSSLLSSLFPSPLLVSVYLSFSLSREIYFSTTKLEIN